ncbi:JAB domain-containing protein [Bacillus cereus]|uniref:JAB domain-containing protein n=1 Tax=Bacillus cereus TaxID=1396 RepID=UPI002ABF2CA4|nr:JAB domain-containing protein [Bacillus cereus]MDZ4467977.1 hypothetical protein [Bacillus cereus]MDZ4526791.1 hypothetical protein [Bacillus cereus]
MDGVNCEHFMVMYLDTKKKPVNISVAHICSLNSGIVYPHEVMKTNALSNIASIFGVSKPVNRILKVMMLI